MSLDVYLYIEIDENEVELYWANITSNLNNMAEKAGIYRYLWRPEELDIKKANELIEPLTVGVAKLKGDRDYFKRFDATNGWGTYDDFLPWVENYLDACKQFPSAFISVSK